MKVLATALAAMGLSASAAAGPYDEARALRAEAAAALEAEDYDTARAALRAANALISGHPSILLNLAYAARLSGDEAAMARWLDAYAGYGVATSEATLAYVVGAPPSEAAQPALAQIRANRSPQGEAVLAAEIPAEHRLIEGVAYDSETGDLFAGSVVDGRILRISSDGEATVLNDGAAIPGAFALHWDGLRGWLWAGSGSAEPSVLDDGETGAGAILALSAETGRVAFTAYPPDGMETPRLADFTQAPNGDLYISDGAAPRIWRLRAGADRLEVFAEHEGFASLQGLAVLGDALYAADYGVGVWRIGLDDGAVTRLDGLGRVSLIGLDGLYAHDGDLIAIRNGVAPYGVFRLTLDSGGVAVAGARALYAGHEDLFDPTLGAVSGEAFYFIANSQWPIYGAAGETSQDPEPTRILRLRLGPG